MSNQPKPLIIGLSGKAEHGKTASARIISEASAEVGLTAQIFEISKLIQQHCIALGLLPADLPREQYGPEHIKVLVDEGNRMREVGGPNYWVNQFMGWIGVSVCDIALVPNIRFPQEIDAIHAQGGFIVRLQRINVDGSPFISTTRDPNDVTEISVDKAAFDIYIVNVTGRGKLLEELVHGAFRYILQETKHGSN